ncbi:hypothetical protein [Bacillus thuringiensis]|uniref:hypothetical protein n=1 Tax=Bacillus thuringiensis TaxID=1428 RepID=UPI001EDF4BAE|nr:hypothetical protein [Bacillus thuringiensis]MCG3426825.1 hypothetical protein [Bacillus thuringiensis]
MNKFNKCNYIPFPCVFPPVDQDFTGAIEVTGPTGGAAFSNEFGQFATSGQITIGINSILPLNLINTNNTFGFSLAGGRVTVQNPGLYAIDTGVTLDTTSSAIFIIRVNGVSTTSTARSSIGTVGGIASSTTLIRLNSNDVVDIFRSGGTGIVSIFNPIGLQIRN